MEETAVTKEDDQDDVILRVRKNQTTENLTACMKINTNACAFMIFMQNIKLYANL